MPRNLVFFFMILFSVCFFAPASALSAEKATMEADTLTYNVNTKRATAVGNVVIKKDGAVLFGNSADGNMESSEFTLKGNVRGNFPKQNAQLVSESLKWKKNPSSKNGIVEAFSNVFLTRGSADKLRAQYVRWETDTENYAARGNVDAISESRILKAGEAVRNGDKFWGKNVTRYEDRVKKVGFSAASVEGTFRGKLMAEVVASGSVSIDYVDKAGLKTVVTGDKAIYSKDRGTVVISGNASAVRSDGKVVTADNLVLHEESKNIEAIGRSKITFDMPKNDKKANSEAKGN